MKASNVTPFAIILLCILVTTSSIAREIPKYKIDVATKVLNDLKAAKGIFAHERPYFKMEKVFTRGDDMSIAYINYPTSEIFLEESMYDLCANHLGADSLNGLAFVLGHELAHFLNNDTDISHGKKRNNTSILDDKLFLSLMQDKVGVLDSMDKKELEVSIQQYKNREGESNADLQGGFLAYLAGYHSNQKDPSIPAKFLEMAYIVADLETESEEYPSLAERQKISSSAGLVLDSLIAIFEMANDLTAIEQYPEALTYYEKVAISFQSREVYNNMGSVCLLDATKCFDPEELPLNIPITLDLDSRSGNTSGKGGRTAYTDQIRNQKLDKAIGYFQKSIYYDDNYPIAHLNLSIARMLRGISTKLSSTIPDSIKGSILEEEFLLSSASLVNAKNISYCILNDLKENNLSGESDEVLSVKSVLSNVHLQWSILYNQNGSIEESEKHKKKAIEINPDNIYMSTIGGEITMGSRAELKCGSHENVDAEISLFDAYTAMKGKWKVETLIKEVQGVDFLELQSMSEFLGENYDAVMHKSKFNPLQTDTIIIVYPKNIEETICGVKKGDNLDVLRQDDRYGDPTHFFLLNNGGYFTYDKTPIVDNTDPNELTFLHTGIVFHLDQKGEVDRWFNYIKLKNVVK